MTAPRHIRHGAGAALTGIALLVALATPAQASNLLINGSFELPAVGYALLPGGSSAITGWTTVLNGVEHFNATSFGGAADGVMVVDLASYTYSAGGLEQTVATTVGQAYDISFMAGNLKASGRTGTGNILVSVDGGAALSFATPVATTASLVWEQRQFSFTAATAATTIRFWNNQDANVYFANLDGVALQASPVPEPSAAWLLASGLLLVGRLLSRRAGWPG